MANLDVLTISPKDVAMPLQNGDTYFPMDSIIVLGIQGSREIVHVAQAMEKSSVVSKLPLVKCCQIKMNSGITIEIHFEVNIRFKIPERKTFVPHC